MRINLLGVVTSFRLPITMTASNSRNELFEEMCPFHSSLLLSSNEKITWWYLSRRKTNYNNSLCLFIDSVLASGKTSWETSLGDHCTCRNKHPLFVFLIPEDKWAKSTFEMTLQRSFQRSILSSLVSAPFSTFSAWIRLLPTFPLWLPIIFPR